MVLTASGEIQQFLCSARLPGIFVSPDPGLHLTKKYTVLYGNPHIRNQLGFIGVNIRDRQTHGQPIGQSKPPPWSAKSNSDYMLLHSTV